MLTVKRPVVTETITLLNFIICKKETLSADFRIREDFYTSFNLVGFRSNFYKLGLPLCSINFMLLFKENSQPSIIESSFYHFRCKARAIQKKI